MPPTPIASPPRFMPMIVNARKLVKGRNYMGKWVSMTLKLRHGNRLGIYRSRSMGQSISRNEA
jgi:hypothetical protein